MKTAATQLVCLCAVLTLASAGTELYAQSSPTPYTSASPGTSKIVVRLPTARDGYDGRLVVRPNVDVLGEDVSAGYVPSPAPAYSESESYSLPETHVNSYSNPTWKGDGWAKEDKRRLRDVADKWGMDRIFDKPRAVADYIWDELHGGTDCYECSPLKRMFGFDVHKNSFDKGIGRERVPLALMEMDITQPLNRYSTKFIANFDTPTPDRAEFLWKSPAFGGPKPEVSVDWQEIRVWAETGGDRFSFFTEYPLRIVNPVVNSATAGFGDMLIGNKLVLIDGNDWQVTQVFRTWFATGSARKGLGTGHVTMEPGILARFRWTDKTYLHYELKYNFPIAGSPGYAGQVLRYGFGMSHLLYETDTWAVIPTLEFVGWSVMDGLKTLPNGKVADVNHEQFMSILPGTRFVLGPAGDLGLFELGIAGGFNTSNNGFYSKQLQLHLRFSY